jgi:ADP-ribosylglycohydrolase
VSSIAYRLALVAAGDGVAAVALNGPSSWDYAAGHALLRGVGGTMVDESGAEVSYGPDGGGTTRWCFSGGPAVIEALRHRDWAPVGIRGFGSATPPPEFEPARLIPGQLLHDSGALSRAQGCLFGQLGGDSLGALVSSLSADRIDRDFSDGGPRRLADGGPLSVCAGQPTASSELALILARTVVRDGAFSPEATAMSYAAWYHGWSAELEPPAEAWHRPFHLPEALARALDPITVASARDCTAAEIATMAADPDDRSSAALARISPLGIWGWRRDQAELAEAARAEARLTHPNPLCQESAALLTVTIAQAIRHGLGPLATFQFASDWAQAHCREPAVTAVLEYASLMPPLDYERQTDQVLIALQNAFYHLLHDQELEDGVVATVRAGANTSANAAICGALLGAVHGREAVPAQWRRLILTCRPMPGHSHLRQPRPATYWTTDALILAERLLSAG